MQADHLVSIDEKKLNEEYKNFVTEYMPKYSTYEHIHKQIKNFKIIGGIKTDTKKESIRFNVYPLYRFP